MADHDFNCAQAMQALETLSDYACNELRTNIVDLVANLQHLCVREELSFTDIVRSATIHTQEELFPHDYNADAGYCVGDELKEDADAFADEEAYCSSREAPDIAEGGGSD